MPSIANLAQFKQDIQALAKEPQVRSERGEPFDDIPLPEETISSASAQTIDNDLAALLGVATPDSDSVTEKSVPPVEPVDALFENMAPESVTADDTDYDISNFANLLDTLPLDTTDAEVSTDVAASTDAEASAVPDIEDAATDTDDFSIPGGLLDGLADSLDASNATADDYVPPVDGIDTESTIPELTNEAQTNDVDVSDFSLDDLPSFDTNNEVEENPAPADAVPTTTATGIPASFKSGDTGLSAGIDLTPDMEDFSPVEESDTTGGIQNDDSESITVPSFNDDAATSVDLPNFAEPAADSALENEVAELDDSLPPIEEAENVDDFGDNLSIDDIQIPTFDDSNASSNDFSLPDFSDDATPSTADSNSTDIDINEFSFDEPAKDADELLSTVDTEPFSTDIAADTILPDFNSNSLEAPTPEEEADFIANVNTPSDINDIAAGFNTNDDTFSQFSLDSNFVNESFNFAENSLTDLGSEDFSFDGIPELDGNAFGAKPGTTAKTNKAVTFSIQEKDFDTFMNTLALYPLNLRIEIEDLIVNTQLPDSTIQDIVNKVVGGTPARSIANDVSQITGKPIEIPKDFEKKSAESREQELNSFGYILRYKILPVATIGALVLILLGCISYLSYEFIFRPLRATSYYKEGYACIEDKRYAESASLFNKAVSYNEKKEWYYKYARAYTKSKQYQLAENMYDRMIFRYPKDKNPPLEYARMECEELHNYPKAENIVRRSVLDNFVNDKDGLLLLGDIFMAWGETDYSKYSQAGETYNMLIELYGSNDTYLSRKLLYNIRTDDLGEVLPLKDHFMQAKHTLEPYIQIELGGYLLEKRYQSVGSDDEYLRILIEDVRTCLQKGIDAGADIPEAYYNMGKYFLYTGNSGAKNMFLRSVDLFETTEHMNPARIMRNIDACRLLGETYIRGNESLAAAEVYNRGKRKYETALAARTITKDARAGELYADIADIDYFLTGDLNNAQHYYREAIGNLYDTPQVRYKMGFINYYNGHYEDALDSLIRASAAMPEDENTMFALGNTLFKRKDFAAAQGYYTRLLHRLEAQKTRLGILFPQVRVDHGDFVQTYMETANNLAVTLFKLSERTGDAYKHSESGVLLTEALRAYDALTRNPETLARLSGGNLPELNIKYSRYPDPSYEPAIYTNIDQLPDHQHPFKNGK